MSGLIALFQSRKGVVTLITIISQVLLGLLSDKVDTETLLATLAATSVGHSIGQGIADKGSSTSAVKNSLTYTDSEGGKF